MTEIARISPVTSVFALLSPVNFYMRDADRIFTGNTGRKYWLRDDRTYDYLRYRLNRALMVGLGLVLIVAIFLRVEWAMIVFCWVLAGTFVFEHAQVQAHGIRVPNAAAEFLIEVRRQQSHGTVTPDFPNGWQGDAFFDIENGEATCTVSFRPGVGFGFSGSDHIYGERPEKIIKSVRDAVKEVGKRLNDAKP